MSTQLSYEIESELDRYVDAHCSAEPEHLRELTRQTNLRLVNGRMASGHLQGRLLKILTQTCAPKTALELGTFSGYSALCIAEGLPEGSRLITVEADDELEDFIRMQFEKAGLADRIDLRIGKALEICRALPDESMDMVFIDADKREYPRYLEEAVRIARRGALIIADNTLWSGHVCDPAYDRDPQTLGVRQMNDAAAAHPRLETVILPFRDGITLMRKT